MNPVILQLADSAFPTGAFAHSHGLEALHKLGLVDGEPALEVRVREIVWTTAHGALPFVAHAHARDAREADLANEAFLSSRVANRASRAQGAALKLSARAAFGLSFALPCGHASPMLGAIGRELGLSLADTQRVALFGAARSALSAAVRLGACGPLRAQALLFFLGRELDAALDAVAGHFADDATSTSPLAELCQGAQDRLYTRLFQS